MTPRSPIDMLLDRVDWKCAKCGVSTKVGCDCLVTLECPNCKKTRKVFRESDDPQHAKIIMMRCPLCWDADVKSGGDR